MAGTEALRCLQGWTGSVFQVRNFVSPCRSIVNKLFGNIYVKNIIMIKIIIILKIFSTFDIYTR